MLSVSISKKLYNFTLEIEFAMENHILILFGPSGCGKTTILRCIAGLMRPEDGLILHNERMLFSAAQKVFIPTCQRQIGYMLQEQALFPHMNIKENIWYGVHKRTKKTDDLYAKLVYLLGLRTLTSRRIENLSGGERQKVALARALMVDPAILLLDEPFSALDSTSRCELQVAVKELQAAWGIPFIIVTHNCKEAKALGDQILFMEQGCQTTAPM